MSNTDQRDKGDNSDLPSVALADTMDSGERLGGVKPFSASDAGMEGKRSNTGTNEIVGSVLNNRYSVTKKIGQGGMGAVYEATHNLIGKRVALKVLLDKHVENDQVVARLKQEARLASSIGHKNIIDITDFGTTESGRTFVVMEYLEGESLGARIAKDGRLSSPHTLHIGKQVADALAAAHDKGIVHRDIKPENIFLVRQDDADFVKVVDFGISKSMSEQGEDLRLTHTGMVLGTPLYMSPEQARGDEDLDHRIDIYALGVLLYESLTGEVPFQGKNYLSILTQVTSETPKTPREIVPDIDRDLESIVLKAMARDRNERYQSMREFAADLEVLDDSSAHTTSGRIVAARWRRKKERSPKRVYIVGTLAALAVAGASIWGVNMLMGEEDTAAEPEPLITIRPVPAVDASIPPTTDKVEIPTDPKTIGVTIHSAPNGVAIYNGERRMCERTPCNLEFLSDSSEILLRATHPGYKEGSLPITPALDAGKILTISLTKSPTARPNGRLRKNSKHREKEEKPPKPDTSNRSRDGSGELRPNPFGKAAQ